MRKIKFRAIIPNIDKELSMSQKPFITIYFELEHLIETIFSPVEFAGRQVILKNWICDGNVPDQYTGLKDKFRREIFENDIVEYSMHAREAGVIVFRDGSFLLVRHDDWCLTDLEEEKGCFLEVLGNVHENHELIEVEHE